MPNLTPFLSNVTPFFLSDFYPISHLLVVQLHTFSYYFHTFFAQSHTFFNEFFYPIPHIFIVQSHTFFVQIGIIFLEYLLPNHAPLLSNLAPFLPNLAPFLSNFAPFSLIHFYPISHLFVAQSCTLIYYFHTFLAQSDTFFLYQFYLNLIGVL